MARTDNKTSQAQRLEHIRQKLLKAGEISIKKLAGEFNVSGMTICRDLDTLESQGEILRTHGGAVPAKKLTFDFAFRDKINKNQKQKHLIAQQAVKHTKDGQVIMLDTGTTTLYIARELIGRRKVRIITASLAIVSELQFAKNIEVVLLGGFLRGDSPDMHGPLTEQNIELFKADVAFIGADAIDLNGNTYTDDLRLVNLTKKMGLNADKVIVVADSSKFRKSGMCRIFSPADYNLIISDSKVDKKTVRRLAGRKINVELT
jgi:DeoR family transcriptional regulator, fructose operon transcriptional repressor